MNEFEEADSVVGVVEVAEKPTTLPAESNKGNLPANVIEYREQLVRQYHKGAPSLVEKIRQAGKEDIESLLVALIEEVVTETDHLLGNELVATHNGELRDASIISFKRAEVIEKAIKAVQSKQEFERQGGINVDSPAVLTIFRFFMAKAKETFDKMGTGNETSDLFFRTFSGMMEGWKKELRVRFEELRNQR
jgi:hypothetical protein